MSADCCGHGTTFEGLSADYKRRLWLVIALNATMFLVEMGAGGSTAYHVLILGVPRAEIMGVNRCSGLGRQRGQRPHPHAVQRWRCQRALRLAVFTQ